MFSFVAGIAGQGRSKCVHVFVGPSSPVKKINCDPTCIFGGEQGVPINMGISTVSPEFPNASPLRTCSGRIVATPLISLLSPRFFLYFVTSPTELWELSRPIFLAVESFG